MHKTSQIILDRILKESDPKKAAWLENYVKHNIQSKGVGIPIIREIIETTEKEFGISSLSIGEQVEILMDLMNQDITEGKLAAILYMQLFWESVDPKIKLELISEWFDNEYIYDWNVCDWLCVRILNHLVDDNTEVVIQELKQWNKDPYLWKARASLVAFAQCKSIQEHKSKIHEFSEVLIQREERFCKTAVGWVLREISKTDKEFVSLFISNYKNYFTKEVFKNATKYFS